MARRSPTTARVRTAVALTVAIASTGCMTGERPTLGTSPTQAGAPSGDPNVDAVLALLDQVGSAAFTAHYTVTLRFGGTETPLVASQDGAGRRSVTIGDTRYLTELQSTRTCTVSTAQCGEGIDPQPVSNTGATPDLVVGGVAKRLRRFAPARTSATTLTSSAIAGQPSTCVDLPLGNGTSTVCALADGAVGRLIDGDITVELTSYSPEVDEQLFTI